MITDFFEDREFSEKENDDKDTVYSDYDNDFYTPW